MVSTSDLDSAAPEPHASFRASDYFDSFEILKIKIEYELDLSLNMMKVRQHLVARRNAHGPNGWCAPLRTPTQSYTYSIEGTELKSRRIQDNNRRWFSVVNFDGRVSLPGETVAFTTETNQRVDSVIRDAKGRTATVFLSRIFGSSCYDCEVSVQIPSAYYLSNSVPQLDGAGGSYRLFTQFMALSPMNINLELRRGRAVRLRKWWARNQRIALWTIIGVIITVIVTLIVGSKK